MPAKASWTPVKVFPGDEVVNVGSTRLSVTKVVSTASAPPDPSTLNSRTRWRSGPSTSAIPTTPLQVIIIAAKTVSRASEAASSAEDIRVAPALAPRSQVGEGPPSAAPREQENAARFKRHADKTC